MNAHTATGPGTATARRKDLTEPDPFPLLPCCLTWCRKLPHFSSARPDAPLTRRPPPAKHPALPPLGPVSLSRPALSRCHKPPPFCLAANPLPPLLTRMTVSLSRPARSSRCRAMNSSASCSTILP